MRRQMQHAVPGGTSLECRLARIATDEDLGLSHRRCDTGVPDPRQVAYLLTSATKRLKGDLLQAAARHRRAS